MKIKLNDVAGAKGCLPNKKEKVKSHALCGSVCCCDDEVYSYNEAVAQQNACDVWLDEEELLKVCTKYFIHLGAQIKTEGKSNPDKKVSPGRELAKSICANSQKIIRMGKGV